jgi:hypothetical protein
VGRGAGGAGARTRRRCVTTRAQNRPRTMLAATIESQREREHTRTHLCGHALFVLPSVDLAADQYEEARRPVRRVLVSVRLRGRRRSTSRHPTGLPKSNSRPGQL